MGRFLRLAAVGASAATLASLGIVGVAAPAGATPPTGYGFDGTPHVIVGGGSDTTWNAMTGLTSLSAGLTGLYLGSPGCPTNNGATATLGSCVTNAAVEKNTLGDYQHDTVAQANPTGSSAGIASLNGLPVGVSYAGAVNGAPGIANSAPQVDFARSSRAPKTSGSSACGGGNELTCDTFWGYAQDGVEVMAFNAPAGSTFNARFPAGQNGRGDQLQTLAGGAGLSDAEIFHIYNCDYHNWSDIPSLASQVPVGSPTDGPIVAWGMNSSSGTYGTFNSRMIAAGGAPPGWVADGQSCVHHETAAGVDAGTYPFENDVKPIFNDVNTTGMDAAGPQPAAPAGIAAQGACCPALPAGLTDPMNWIWFSSFGILSNFPFTANATVPAPVSTTFSSLAAPVDGIVPSGSTILANTYPIGRTLYHVTRKADADCATHPCSTVAGGPTLPSGTGTDINLVGTTGRIVTDGATTAGSTTLTSATAAFTLADVGRSIESPGSGDIAVGSTIVSFTDAATVVISRPAASTATGVKVDIGGRGGAVGEFTRFLCRGSRTQQATNPLTNKNYDGELTSVINKAGFQVVPGALKTPGSRCQVLS